MANEEDRVVEWEKGLPSLEELIPLTKPLITPELASAFSITQEPCRTPADVLRASQATVAALRRLSSAPIPGIDSIPVFAEESQDRNGGFCYNTEGRSRASTGTPGAGSSGAASQGTFGTGFQNQAVQSNTPFEGTKRAEGTGASSTVNGVSYSSYERRPDNAVDSEEADSGGNPENSSEDPEPGARTLKRPRLVWTPQLHKRFVDAVAHLGIKNAVPKTIMQLMNVEGLTRENVASHLQKYRLYLKRMQGLSSEGPSASDHLFASTPVPPALAASAHFLQPHRDDMLPLPFPGTVVPVPITGLSPHHLGAPHPYAPFDHLQYGGLARGPQRVPSGDHVDNQPQNGSPGLLTLFPNH